MQQVLGNQAGSDASDGIRLFSLQFFWFPKMLWPWNAVPISLFSLTFKEVKTVVTFIFASKFFNFVFL